MSAHSIVRMLVVVLVYGATYAVLTVLEVPFAVSSSVTSGLTAGLNLALVVAFGPAYLAAVLLATITGGAAVDIPLLHLLGPGLSVALGYGAAAWWLRRRQETASALRFVGPLAAMALVLPALVDGLAVLSFTLTGWLPGDLWAPTAIEWWLRDTAGILTLAPVLLIALRPRIPAWTDELATLNGLLPPPQRNVVLEFLMEVGGVVLALYLAFFLPGTDGYLYYVCLLPVLVVAWQHGLPRTALVVALLNGGVLLAEHVQNTAADGETGLFMIVLALTGLILGALVTDHRQRLSVLTNVQNGLEARVAAHTSALKKARAERARVEASLERSIEELEARRDDLNTFIDEQQRLNDKLRASEEQLKELNARKDKFFSIVSHDVRNMLISAIGFSKLLISDAETLPREMVKEFASHVHSSTTNTYDLLENLLTWAQMQTGRMYYQRAWHGMDELIRNNITMLQDNAARKDITLERRGGDRNAQVYADRNMINSVLQNLISNAIKFTPRGGAVTVSAHTYENTIEIAVSDTGVGISPEKIDKLFRIDQQVSTEGTEEEEGTGLGLVLCKEMIEKNDGRIWVESEVGQGSTFRFTLPCAVEAEDADAVEDAVDVQSDAPAAVE